MIGLVVGRRRRRQEAAGGHSGNFTVCEGGVNEYNSSQIEEREREREWSS